MDTARDGDSALGVLLLVFLVLASFQLSVALFWLPIKWSASFAVIGHTLLLHATIGQDDFSQGWNEANTKTKVKLQVHCYTLKEKVMHSKKHGLE